MQGDIEICGVSSRGRTLKRKITNQESEPPEKSIAWQRKDERLMRLKREDSIKEIQRKCPDLIQDEDILQVINNDHGDILLFESGGSPYAKAMNREKSFLRNTKNADCETDESGNRDGSNLDEKTATLINLIFHDQIFKNQISRAYLDIRLRTLKKMDRNRVLMANVVLCGIEKAIQEGRGDNIISDLSKSFYSIIKHDFGWLPAPVINSKELVTQKRKVLMSLSDILIAHALKELCKSSSEHEDPSADELYDILDIDLKLLSSSTKEYKRIERYAEASSEEENKKYKLIDIWGIKKESDQGFESHRNLGHRKLLWRGTGAASVAATLREGLRMPTYEGKMGKGLYFNSNFQKALSNVDIDPILKEDGGKVAFLFLCEVPLGRSKAYQRAQPHLSSPPPGFDSVVGKGKFEPKRKSNVAISMDGSSVVIPLGAPVLQKKFKRSKFKHSKYVVHKSSQVKLRYLVKFHVYQ